MARARSRRTAVWPALVAVLLGLLAACGGGGAQTTDLGDPATLGQRTFAQWCAPCHGVEGEGNINALEAPALNAAGDSHLLTDAEILDGIIKGGTQEGSTMQPLGEFPDSGAADGGAVLRPHAVERRAAGHPRSGRRPHPADARALKRGQVPRAREERSSLAPFLAEARHGVGVNELAVAIGDAAQRALDLEAKLRVETYGRLVVGVDLQP
jgi:mono/diheme cytochrome c family protein